MASKSTTNRERAEHLGPEQRRPLVLDAALPLFIEHGYYETSMDAIAEAARVTKPVLYDCYPNKDALLRALVDREEGRVLKQMTDAFPKDPDINNVEQLLIDAYTASFKAAAANPLAWRALYVAEQSAIPEVAERIHKGRKTQEALINEIVRAYLDQQGVSESDRLGVLFARIIMAAGDAAARLMLEDLEFWDPEELGRILGRTLIRGEKARRDDEGA